ncbi:16001_t:CDS:2 [Acaulospora morrowiae]|uniref:16001_t:CDS:1 n=1 Tax=Acaulospora morrowiae TaxID=94023 RepID=A0A9N8V782_9GLOM|nr:16001_t:CDS:2 [Acaulospora morrowiae]
MSYAAGTIVYAKLKGYPWWPARVEVESSLPSNVLSKKPKGPKPIYGVRFYGTRDYGWFGNNDLRPFDKKEAEVSLQKMKSKKRDKLLERSIREALDPASFEDPMDEDAEEGAATEDDAEMEEESKKSNESDDDIEYEKKSKSRGKGIKKPKKPTSPKASERRKKSPGSTKSKRKDRVYSSGDEETLGHSGKIGKKRRTNDGSNMDKSSRRRKKFDYTDDEMELDEPSPEERKQNLKNRGVSRSEGSKSPGKSDNGSPGGEEENKQITTDDNSKTSKLDSEGQSRSTKSRQTKPPSAKLLHLRHKVQKLVLKNPEFEKLDKSKVDELFTEVENFPVTVPLLKESKIGKVMRKIAELKIEPDNYNIVGRSEELIKKWKCLLDTQTQEGTEEEASPKMPHMEGESPQNEDAVKLEESNQTTKVESQSDVKKGKDGAESNEGNLSKEISSMDLDPVESRVEDEKRVTGDNVTNESPSVANSQGGPTNESEVHAKTEL